jgi:hypothetical protein
MEFKLFFTDVDKNLINETSLITNRNYSDEETE